MIGDVLLDTTVLCNFASVGQLDLLESLLRGRGRWTEAVAYEVSRSTQWLADLRRVQPAGWLGDPIEIEEPCAVEGVERLRRGVLGGTAGRPLQHLGEAQTLYLLMHDTAFAGCRWVSDDRSAVVFARRQQLLVWQTQDLVGDGRGHG